MVLVQRGPNLWEKFQRAWRPCEIVRYDWSKPVEKFQHRKVPANGITPVPVHSDWSLTTIVKPRCSDWLSHRGRGGSSQSEVAAGYTPWVCNRYRRTILAVMQPPPARIGARAKAGADKSCRAKRGRGANRTHATPPKNNRKKATFCYYIRPVGYAALRAAAPTFKCGQSYILIGSRAARSKPVQVPARMTPM